MGFSWRHRTLLRARPLVTRFAAYGGGSGSYVLLVAGLLALIGCGSTARPADQNKGGSDATLTNCSSGDCPCADAGVNLSLCDDECVSLQTDSTNCGACGRACAAGQTCAAGSCMCSSGGRACGGSCVDITNDSQNCGACGKRCAATELCDGSRCVPNTTGCIPACSGGQRCELGSCVCPSSQNYCGERCVDVQSDAANCGACGAACGAKQLCSAGACTCDGGATACGSRCVDVQSDTANCGACGHACNGFERCNSGNCQSVWSDGCRDVSAHDVQLRELAVYQSIKVPIFNQNGPVAPENRVAQVISGRAALFRAFIDVSGGFTTRNLSARLTVKNGATIDRYASKQAISNSSTDNDASNTFQLQVPASKISETTSYYLELVECAAASGASLGTRFPASGEDKLLPHKTGSLKVTLIPVRVNSRVPDLTDESLQFYRAYVEAMYPIEQLELTVGDQISTASPVNWNDLVLQILKKREQDKPADDVYYYGVVQPTKELRDYCRGGCTAGIGYVNDKNMPAVRAAVGLAYVDEISASTMAHELGHNHGRKHSLCPPNIQGADENSKDAMVGTWGYDVRRNAFLDPSSTLDVMGYCDPKWISTTTYDALVDRITDVNKTGGIIPNDNPTFELYRVLLVEPDGPRWSLPYTEPIAAYGEPELADVLDIDGQPIAQVIVYRTALPEGNSFVLLVPEPEPGWNAIRVAGSVPLAFSAPVTVPMPEP